MHLYQKAAFLISSINRIITTTTLYYLFFSVFKCLNDLDPVALSEEPNVSQFYRIFFFFSDQKTKQNLQVLYFSAFLSLAIMHRNSMPVSVFRLAFDVTRKLNPTYPEVLATWTEPKKRNAFSRGEKKRHVSKARPQTTLIYQSCT